MTAIGLMAAAACAGKKDYPEAPEYVPHPKGEFPITATYAFSQPLICDEQFELVKEAGFNTIGQLLSPADLDSCLVLAEKHDINVTAVPWGIRDLSTVRERASRYKDNPMVWGFAMWDEPDASQFDFLRQLNDSLTSEAPRQNGFFNLLPAVGAKQLGAPDYRTYVEDFVRTVNPPYLSLDIYPVKLDGDDRIFVDPVLYKTMEVIRDVARDSGRPFWSYILSNKHWRYPKPTEENIRFQVFTALGYGAQGLRYFTYCMPDFDKEAHEFSEAPIDWDGNRTDTWYMVRNVNKEVQNLADVFLGAEVLNVTQTGARIPEGTRRATRLPLPFRGIESFGEGVMVSHLKNGDHQYLLLVNRDVENNQRVRLSRTRPVTRLYGNGTQKQDNSSSLTLEPGGYALFRF